MAVMRKTLEKFPSIDALVALAANALRTISPRTIVDVGEKSAIEETGDQWAILTRTQRIGCFQVVDARECIEMGIKGLGEARTLEIKSSDVVGASIAIRVTSGPGVKTELTATFEGIDDERTQSALATFAAAL